MRDVNAHSENELPVRIYASGENFGIVKTLRSFFREFSAAHALGYRFAERNLRARYRQSVLGIFWAFLSPIATSLIWIILYKSGVVSMKTVGVPYPLFVLTGTMCWSIFANAILLPMQTLQANRSILVKINFPREALLVNAFYEILFTTAVAIIIIVAELLIFRVPLDWHMLLFVPAMFLLIFLGMAIGLTLLPLSILYKDVQFALPALLQFAMYLTPVVYAKPIYSGATRILAFNPVTPVLTSARSWLLGLDMAAPAWQLLLIASCTAVVLFFGILLQRISVAILIERMGS